MKTMVAVVAILLALLPGQDPPDEKQVRAWIKELASENIETRERATKNLLAQGEPVLPLLRPHADAGDAEVRARIAQIVRRLERFPVDALWKGVQDAVQGRRELKENWQGPLQKLTERLTQEFSKACGKDSPVAVAKAFETALKALQVGDTVDLNKLESRALVIEGGRANHLKGVLVVAGGDINLNHVEECIVICAGNAELNNVTKSIVVVKGNVRSNSTHDSILCATGRVELNQTLRSQVVAVGGLEANHTENAVIVNSRLVKVGLINASKVLSSARLPGSED